MLLSADKDLSVEADGAISLAVRRGRLIVARFYMVDDDVSGVRAVARDFVEWRSKRDDGALWEVLAQASLSMDPPSSVDEWDGNLTPWHVSRATIVDGRCRIECTTTIHVKAADRASAAAAARCRIPALTAPARYHPAISFTIDDLFVKPA